MTKKKVLIIGGTGYLGQNLLLELSNYSNNNNSSFQIAFTYHSTPNPPQNLLEALHHSHSFPLDLASGQGFDSISKGFGQPDVVVNCAAISVPRACEVDRDTAMSVNVPTSLVNWVTSFKDTTPLLIHLSSDQVYEGTKSFYKEEDETRPVNTYGKSKVEAENFISSNYSNFAILRSSIIYGPQTVSPVPKSLPIQWIDDVLLKGDKIDLFYDEFRCPVYVKDVVAVIIALTKRWVADYTDAISVKSWWTRSGFSGPDGGSRCRCPRIRNNFDKSGICIIG